MLFTGMQDSNPLPRTIYRDLSPVYSTLAYLFVNLKTSLNTQSGLCEIQISVMPISELISRSWEI
jgi:hypothetical protein